MSVDLPDGSAVLSTKLVPAPRRSAFDLSVGPDRIILYQKNVEAVCCNEIEISLGPTSFHAVRKDSSGGLLDLG